MARAPIEDTEQLLKDAMAATEKEIADEAFNDEPETGDGDRSLEEMDDDIDEQPEEGKKVDPDEEEGEEVEAQADDEDGEPEAEAEEQPERRQDGRTVALREERQRRQELERELAEMRGKLSVLDRPAPQPAKEQPSKPDMFADPEGYETWVLEQAENRAAAKYQQLRQEENGERLNRSFSALAQGPRGFEFGPAYERLTSLDKTNPQHRAVVQGIVNSADPAEALMNWWDQNGGEDYRENIRAQLFPDQQAQRQSRSANGRSAERPQHVIRGPQRMPSLNGASGGGSHRSGLDPRGMDGSEESIAAYAFEDR